MATSVAKLERVWTAGIHDLTIVTPCVLAHRKRYPLVIPIQLYHNFKD